MTQQVFTAGEKPTSSKLNAVSNQTIITCTSSTRPASPNEGMTIYETDTDRLLVWDGSAWIRIGWSTTAGRSGFQVRRNASQTIATDTTTQISFDTEDFDSDAGFSATSATVTCQVSGLWNFWSQVMLTADPSQAALQIFHSSLGYIATTEQGSITRPAIYGVYYVACAAAGVPVTVGDTVNLEIRHSAGANRSATARFYGFRVGR